METFLLPSMQPRNESQQFLVSRRPVSGTAAFVKVQAVYLAIVTSEADRDEPSDEQCQQLDIRFLQTLQSYSKRHNSLHTCNTFSLLLELEIHF